MLLQDDGLYADAQEYYQQSLAISEELGDQRGIASTAHQLGVLAQAQGRPTEARRWYERSLEIEENLGNKAGIAASLTQLADLTYAEGDQIEAERLFRLAAKTYEEIDDPLEERQTLLKLMALYKDQGRLNAMAGLLRRVVAIDERQRLPSAAQARHLLDVLQAELDTLKRRRFFGKRRA
jgi:tetratricopeptide (TPR) repeat protein